MDYYFEKLKPITLLLLRCSIALIFLNSGYWKYSHGIAGVQEYMVGLGLPSFFAYLNLALELGGGVLLVLGLFTRPIALLLAIQMGIALWKVDLAQGIYAIPTYQYQLLLCVAALALASVGAGSLSLDAAFGGPQRGARPKPRG